MSKDYYKILGLEKNASSDEIKKAFRALAHKHHPDKAGGDEAKFKEINEAYQVLGNEEKRKKYDQFGSDFEQQGGFGGGMNWEDVMRQARSGGGFGQGFGNIDIDLGDMFGDMFGFGGGGSRGRKKNRGEDIQVDLKIDFRDSVFGAKKIIELYKTVTCSHCHGNLAEPGTKIDTCRTCNGSGRVTRVQQTFIGAIQTAATCPDCRGEGSSFSTPCQECKGQGVVKQNEKIEFDLPAGIEDGQSLQLSGKGNAAKGGGGNGDLYVRVRVKADERFTRDGDDIIQQHKISMYDAALGTKLEVETLDGVIELKVPEGTQPNARFRLKGKGAYRLHTSSRGDLYIELAVEVPTKMSRGEREALEGVRKAKG